MKKIALTILSVIFLLTGLAYAADQGKIAVAAEGKTAAAKVSGVAARSPYFLIFDGTGKLVEAVEPTTTTLLPPGSTARPKAVSSLVPPR